MSRIFTPSERSRRNTNPQPVEIVQGRIRRSRYLVILKNMVGAPVPVLWILFAASLFVGYELHNWIALAISCFTALYIGFDRFSHSREFRFFRIGIEIPLFLTLLFLGFTNLSSGQSFFSGPFTDFSSWAVLLYLLTYSLNLFPGLNRFFFSFVLSGVLYSLFSIWQFFTGNSLIWPNQSFSYFEPLRTGLSIVPTPHAMISGIVVLYCLSFFIYKQRRFSPLSIIMGFAFVVALLSLVVSQQALFYSAIFIPAIYYCVFVSKTVFKDIFLSCMAFSCLYFGTTKLPAVNDFLFSKENIQKNLAQTEYWRDQFESFGENMWLGTTTSIQKIDFIAKGISEDQLFQFESNFYLQMLTQSGLIHFALVILFLISILFMSIRLLNDIPETHHWHKIFVFFLVSSQLFVFVSFLKMVPWVSTQISNLLLCLYAISLYMIEAYTKQIVPDDRSL